MRILRATCLAVAVLAAGMPAHAQQQGVLGAPKPAEKPAPPPTPPKAAPVAPVKQLAPSGDRSSLGTSTPGKGPPVVPSSKNSHAQKPPPGKGKTAAKAAVAAGAVAVGAVAVGAAVASKPADKPTDKAGDKPAEPTAAPVEKPPVNDPNKGSATGQPLPRWAALRSDEVNLRKGPGQRYPIEWVYRRRDLPVLIEREFEVWRLIADQDGVKGWVHSATLTGRRSFVIKGADATIRSRARDDADAVALLKSGVVGQIKACAATADWCEVTAGGFKGWLKRSALYGISPGEAIGS